MFMKLRQLAGTGFEARKASASPLSRLLGVNVSLVLVLVLLIICSTGGVSLIA